LDLRLVLLLEISDLGLVLLLDCSDLGLVLLFHCADFALQLFDQISTSAVVWAMADTGRIAPVTAIIPATALR